MTKTCLAQHRGKAHIRSEEEVLHISGSQIEGFALQATLEPLSQPQTTCCPAQSCHSPLHNAEHEGQPSGHKSQCFQNFYCTGPPCALEDRCTCRPVFPADTMMKIAVNAVPTRPAQRLTGKDAGPDSTHSINAAHFLVLGFATGKGKSQPARQAADSMFQAHTSESVCHV